MDHLPLFLDVRAREVLVVGGGRVAARKIELLARCGAALTVVAPELCDELAARRDAGALRHVAERFAPGHLGSAELVIAATSDRAVNAAASRAARERRIPVNVVDDPEFSTVIFPAIVDRAPITVAIGTSGTSPVLARRLREQIESLLPARLGALARFLAARRAAVRGVLGAAARRPFWERVLRSPAATRVLAGDEAGAEAAFERELRTARLTGAPGMQPLGEVYLIGAGPGDPDLLTLRAVQLLQQADVVLYDRLVSTAVLERARRDAERVFVGKQTGERGVQERIHALLVDYARRGLRVARLKGGDPFIFGRGGEELAVLAAHGIPAIVVPGVTAALGAAAAAGIPLTFRELSRSVSFVAAHELDDGKLDFRALAAPQQTVVWYMGVAALPRISERLLQGGAAPTLPVAIVERATLPEQRVIAATLATVCERARAAGVQAPALLITGEVTRFATPEALASVVGVGGAAPVAA